jgi:NAD(P)-dependent dehydrogenase (short-subunit alcohol dehydrogenase family)
MSRWHNHVVLITGGSRGLGFAIASAFQQAGAQVVLAARDEQQLRFAAMELSASSRECVAIAADVTSDEQVTHLVEQVIEQFGRLDVLINAAGKSARGSVRTTTVDQYQDLLAMNFLSAVRVTNAALPHLLKSRGHVVNIGSLAAKSAGKHLGAYPASKFPLAAWSQQLRLELGPEGLHVLLVCPGPIRRDDAGQRYDDQATELPADARKPGGGVKLKGIDPDWLARRIVLACERRQAELIVPARARLLFAISALSPSLGDWIVRRMSSG